MRLRTILILLVVVGICFPSILVLTGLVQQYEHLMIDNYISTVDNELSRIADSIETYLNTNVVAPSEACIYDDELHALMDFETPQEPSQVLHEYLVKDYLINAHLASKSNYGAPQQRLALLINANHCCFNLAYPIEMVEPDHPFVEKIFSKEIPQYINLNWYGLMKNPFAPEDENMRNQLVAPVTRNIIHPLTQRYVGKQVFLLPEQDLYNIYSKSSLVEKNQIYLIDRERKLISHSDLHMLEQSGQKMEEVKLGLDKKERQYVSQCTIDLNGWTLVCEASLEHIYAGISQKSVQYVAGIGSVLLAICCVVAFAAHELTLPIYELMNSMRRVSKKDFRRTITEKGTRDTIELVQNYNHMLNDMDDLIYHEYEIKRQKQQAELDVLITQINPHFLYNTLESIVWQARAAGASKVADMAHYLGELFNLSVNKGHPMMSIAKELTHVKMYVKLQNMRYDDKINLKISWDDESLLEKQTLKLILQPIVENAILHGMDPDEASFTIYIHVERDGEQMVFYVEDTGIGIEPERLKLINQKLDDPAILYDVHSAENNRLNGNGIGVINVHQRIRLYYGNQYGVRIQSELGQGTCVEVRIPYKDEA